MGQGEGMWVEAKRRDTSMCSEWVTMGWGLFFDTYIPYLTLHVVDLSISLLPLSLSLPSSQLHISLSLFSRLVLSQLTGTFWLLHSRLGRVSE